MSGPGPNESKKDDSSDDLASDIVGVDHYAYTVPAKKEFLPWHRPRKQFVRHEQWTFYIGQLLDELAAEVDTLTYFGLPGIDLLDIRHFTTALCEPRSLKLRFLGFNKDVDPESEGQAELNISFDEISKTSCFDPKSDILPDDIRDLVKEDSLAWQKTLELGPYDVINLDLCDGFGSQPPGELNETYYNAVSKLLAVQARRKKSWLLLLTTRVGKDHVHTKVLDRLSSLYEANLRKCEPFRKASYKKFAISDAKSLQQAKKKSSGIQPIFLVGLCKWLLRLAIEQKPSSKMAVKSVLGYRVKSTSEVEDMVSIAIRFDPTHDPLPDPVKLATIKPTKLDECDLATQALNRIGTLLDVDEYLVSQTTIKNEMIEAMCILLDAARYDVAAYREWVAK